MSGRKLGAAPRQQRTLKNLREAAERTEEGDIGLWHLSITRSQPKHSIATRNLALWRRKS